MCKNLLHYFPSVLPTGEVLLYICWWGGGQKAYVDIVEHSQTAGWIFSIQSSVELYSLVVMHCHGYLPICQIWVSSWAKYLGRKISQYGTLTNFNLSILWSIGWVRVCHSWDALVFFYSLQWGLIQMTIILLTVISLGFWKYNLQFWFKFHLSLFLKVQIENKPSLGLLMTWSWK